MEQVVQLAVAVRAAQEHHRVPQARYQDGYGNLALVYQATGRVAEAIPLYEQVLANFNRLLGADHPDTIAVRETLAAAVSQTHEQKGQTESK